jgi:hypothetical protein
MNPIRHFFVDFVARFRRSEPAKPRLGTLFQEQSPIPKSAQEAHARLRRILHEGPPIQDLSHNEFMSGWVAMAYIAPALDPDEAGMEDGGWPVGWSPVAAEAFRRFKMKKLTEEELYPRPTRFL